MFEPHDVCSIAALVEELFGAPSIRRTVRVVFGGGPQIFMPRDDVSIDIQLSKACQDDPARYAFQLAHELVHTLDPVPLGCASVLEEGVATWFQHRYMQRHFPDLSDWHVPQPGAYRDACGLIAPHLAGTPNALRHLRERGLSMSAVPVEDLSDALPTASIAELQELVSKFEGWRCAL